MTIVLRDPFLSPLITMLLSPYVILTTVLRAPYVIMTTVLRGPPCVPLPIYHIWSMQQPHAAHSAIQNLNKKLPKAT